MTIPALALALQQVDGAVERAAGGLQPLSLSFMLLSMTAVTALMAWCFWRILRTREHFDPDGTGPGRPPVPGRVERKGKMDEL